MMRTVVIALVTIANPSLGWAAECPRSPEITSEMDTLLSLVQNARSAGEAQPVMNGMWVLWTRAPDEKSQNLLDVGRASIRYADHDKAQTVLSELIAYCPAYAEGYNQRAFSYFLTGSFEDALVDLDAALMLSPRHVAAMSGKVLTLQALEREDEAQILLRKALELNPWLPERVLLDGPKGVPL